MLLVELALLAGELLGVMPRPYCAPAPGSGGIGFMLVTRPPTV
jgi:hypothetical protein